MTRRRPLRWLALIAVAASIGLGTPLGAQAASSTSSPWAQGDADAAHSRSNDSENTLSPSSISGLTLRRSITAPTSSGGPFCPTFGANNVVLSNNRVYGVFAGRVTAYSAATRAQLWRSAFSKSTDWTSVSVTGDLVVAGQENCNSAYNPAGAITAFHAESGSVAWTRTARYGVFDTVVSDGVVLSSEFGKSNHTAIEARSLTTGALLWSQETYCQDFYHAYVVGGRAVFARCNADQSHQRLAALDVHSGRSVWTRNASLQIAAGDTDAATAQHLYVQAASGAIQDLDPATGAVRRTLAGAHAVLAADGPLVFTTCQTNAVCEFPSGRGSHVWSTASEANLAAVADGLLYLNDGQVLSVANGHRVHQMSFDNAGQLVVGDGRLGVVPTPRELDLYGLSGS